MSYRIFNTFEKTSTSAGIPYTIIPSGARLDILAGATLNNASTTIFTGTTSIGTSNTSGIVLTSSATNGLQVVAEDGGVAVTSGNIKAIKGRLFLKANCGDCTADGILGQVKVNTSITCSADYTNGIRGYLELVGGNTVNTGGANANIGAGGHAIHGWITAAADLTISANHYLCGVASRLSVSATKTITTTGVLAAYGVFADDNLGGATPTQKWGYGLYLTSGVATTGIYVGTVTTGIDFAGTMNTAIDMNSITVGTNAGGDQASLIRCGTAGAKKLFATNYQQGMLFHLKTTGGRFTGLEMNVYTEDESEAAGRELRGVHVIARSLAHGGADDIYATNSAIEIASGRSAPNTGRKAVAGYFSYSVDAAADNVGGSAYVLYLETGSGKNMTEGDFMIKAIANNAAATPISAFLDCAGGASSVFQFENVMTPANGQAWNYLYAVTNTVDNHASGWIKVKMNNGSSYVDRYIQLYDIAL